MVEKLEDKLASNDFSPEEIDELLRIVDEASKIVEQQSKQAPPQAGSIELDRQLAMLQSGAMPMAMQPASAAMPIHFYQHQLPQHQYSQYSHRPIKPEFTKQDWFGSVMALGVIGISAAALATIIAVVVAQFGKAAESESYRQAIERQNQQIQTLAQQAVKASEDSAPQCFGLFVQSCGASQPQQQTTVQPAYYQPPIETQPLQQQPIQQFQGQLIRTVCSSDAIATATPINVRQYGGANFEVIAQVPCGSNVEMVEYRPGSWSPIRVGDRIGFIKSDFLGS